MAKRTDQLEILVSSNSVALIGWEEGSAGQVHSWLEDGGTFHIACFVHPSDQPPSVDIAADRLTRETRFFDYPLSGSFKGKPLIHGNDWLERLKQIGLKQVLVTTGDRRKRLSQIESAKKSGMICINAIHPSVLIMSDVVLHSNVIAHARAFIGYRTEVHDGVIINTGAQLDHHNVVHECATIDPGVTTAGNVTIERCAQLHTRAVVINKKRIGNDSIVGAGAVVISDVPSNVTVVGVPARIVKTRSPIELDE